MRRFPMPGVINPVMVNRVVRTASEIDGRFSNGVAAGGGQVSTKNIKNRET
jgi:hypothetical protein